MGDRQGIFGKVSEVVGKVSVFGNQAMGDRKIGTEELKIIGKIALGSFILWGARRFRTRHAFLGKQLLKAVRRAGKKPIAKHHVAAGPIKILADAGLDAALEAVSRSTPNEIKILTGPHGSGKTTHAIDFLAGDGVAGVFIGCDKKKWADVGETLGEVAISASSPWTRFVYSAFRPASRVFTFEKVFQPLAILEEVAKRMGKEERFVVVLDEVNKVEADTDSDSARRNEVDRFLGFAEAAGNSQANFHVAVIASDFAPVDKKWNEISHTGSRLSLTVPAVAKWDLGELAELLPRASPADLELVRECYGDYTLLGKLQKAAPGRLRETVEEAKKKRATPLREDVKLLHDEEAKECARALLELEFDGNLDVEDWADEASFTDDRRVLLAGSAIKLVKLHLLSFAGHEEEFPPRRFQVASGLARQVLEEWVAGKLQANVAGKLEANETDTE